MVLMAAAGAAVLAMVAWVALREAQRMPGASRGPRGPLRPPSPPPPEAAPDPSASADPWRVHVDADAAVPDADRHEALAAAAALWHVLVEAQPR